MHIILNNHEFLFRSCAFIVALTVVVIVIDVGINVEMVDGKKKIFGDCEKESISEKASMMTPVPGGVGPMTICSLMEQVYKSFMFLRKNNVIQNKTISE